MLDVTELLPHIGFVNAPVVNYKLNFSRQGERWVVIGRLDQVEKAKQSFLHHYGEEAVHLYQVKGLQVFVVKKDGTLAEFWARTEVPFTGFDRERWVRLEAE
jgi:hypothetical protein